MNGTHNWTDDELRLLFDSYLSDHEIEDITRRSKKEIRMMRYHLTAHATCPDNVNLRCRVNHARDELYLIYYNPRADYLNGQYVEYCVSKTFIEKLNKECERSERFNPKKYENKIWKECNNIGYNGDRAEFYDGYKAYKEATPVPWFPPDILHWFDDPFIPIREEVIK